MSEERGMEKGRRNVFTRLVTLVSRDTHSHGPEFIFSMSEFTGHNHSALKR